LIDAAACNQNKKRRTPSNVDSDPPFEL
jgi:hypothetical protein